MIKVLHIINVLFVIVQTGLISLVAYLILLTAAAIGASRKTSITSTSPSTRFLFLIPAHDEQALLPILLKSLNCLDYPSDFYEIYVVADNCADDTARIGREHGAIVLERYNTEESGKGLALQWLLGEIYSLNIDYDAFVFLDADSKVSPNFLKVMDARLVRGERIIQAYYAVEDPGGSSAVALRWAAFAVLHYLRPLGRMKLGASAGLKGNGMVFNAKVMHEHKWSASVTEDIELHMELLLAGERVTFAPDAMVWAEMPETLTRSRTQNVRWEQGRLEMARRYVPSLATASLRESKPSRSFLYFDAIMEHIIPPFSILASLSLVTLLATAGRFAFFRSQPNRANRGGGEKSLNSLSLWLAILTVAGQVVYLFAGLHLTNAPLTVYRSLLKAPLYVLWKGIFYFRIFLGLEKREWVRTERNQE